MAITFNGTDDWDTDSIHDTSTNNSRMTIPSGKNGKWRFDCSVRLDTNTDVVMYLTDDGGTTRWAWHMHDNTDEVSVSWIIDLVATEYMECWAWQNSGANRTTDTNYTRFTATYLGS